MFKRRRDRRVQNQTRIIENLQMQEKSLHDQLVAATAEFERRYAAMQRDRDYFRDQARGNEP